MLMVHAPLLGPRDLEWRVIPAREVAPGICELQPAERSPGDHWIFGPGDRVYVERQGLQDGQPVLIAVAPAPSAA